MNPPRPISRHHGGKWRLYATLKEFFPPAHLYSVYVEPYCGAGSVLLQKEPTRIEVLNDRDEALYKYFNVLRDPAKAEQLRRAVELTTFSRTEFARSWEPADDEIEQVRRYIVRSFQAIGAKNALSKNGWRTRTSKSIWSPCVSWNGWPEQIPLYTARLKHVIIENLPALKVIDIYNAPDAFFYVDPPYPLGTRDQDHKSVYTHEMTDEDHLELLARLQTVEGFVLLSSYPNEMYDGLRLQGWKCHEFKARAQNNAPRTECLWLNPRTAAALEGPLFAGAKSS